MTVSGYKLPVPLISASASSVLLPFDAAEHVAAVTVPLVHEVAPDAV